jgi:hypothetical protein
MAPNGIIYQEQQYLFPMYTEKTVLRQKAAEISDLFFSMKKIFIRL